MNIQPDTTLLTHFDLLGKVWVIAWGEEQAVAYERLADFERDPSKYLVDWATPQLEDFSPVALAHAVKEFYIAYGTPHEKRAYGLDTRPYSVCTRCGNVIHWETDEADWFDAEDDRSDQAPSCAMSEGKAHQPKWLTMGEFRARTAHLPDTFPITADAQSPESGVEGSWYNLVLDHVPTEEELHRGDAPASLLLDLRDDFDTRQW